MITHVLIKCFSIFIVIFLMCPRPSRLTATIGNQQEYYHAIRRSSLAKMSDNDLDEPLQSIIHPAEAETDNLEGTPKDFEPGFNLTDQEILKFKLWDKGVVPYYIDVPSFADKVIRDRIRWFLNRVNSLTSLNFVELPRPPTDEQTRWVFFVNRRGQLACADHTVTNFTNQGVQRVVLGYDCMAMGGELAEAVLSIVGVPAQHNAPNRDRFIKVLYENIAPGKRYLFEKIKDSEWLFHDLDYDYMSASHFHHHKHSVNGRATIITKKSGQGLHYDKRSFSAKDILKIKMLYNFIVKTKKSKNRMSACNKLFSRGKNFNKVKINSQKEKTRPKPKKYLGENEAHDNGSVSEEDENSFEAGEPTTLSGSSILEEEENNANNNNNIRLKKRLKSHDFGRNKTTNGLTNTLSSVRYSYRDPLTYLSDYQTGDENYQRSLAKKKVATSV